MRLRLRSAVSLLSLGCLAALCGCATPTYRLVVRAYEAAQPLGETLAPVCDRPGKLGGRLHDGQAGLSALTRYQAARINALAKTHKGVEQTVAHEADLEGSERRDLQFNLPAGRELRLSVQIAPHGCCGLALRRASVGVFSDCRGAPCGCPRNAESAKDAGGGKPRPYDRNGASRLSLDTRAAGGETSATFSCPMPVGQLVAVELAPRAPSERWTWVLIDAYELERPAARAAPNN